MSLQSCLMTYLKIKLFSYRNKNLTSYFPIQVKKETILLDFFFFFVELMPSKNYKNIQLGFQEHAIQKKKTVYKKMF